MAGRTPTGRDLTHNLTQNRKKAVETTEQEGSEQFWFQLKQARKALKSSKSNFGPWLITRSLQVQALLLQPETGRFLLKTACFSCIFWSNNTCQLSPFLFDHILAHRQRKNGLPNFCFGGPLFYLQLSLDLKKSYNHINRLRCQVGGSFFLKGNMTAGQIQHPGLIT